MIIPPFFHPRADADISTDPVAETSSGPSPNRQSLIVVSAISGAIVLLCILVTIYLVTTRRKRQLLADEYKSARLRNPNLPWEEPARRKKPSRSRLVLKEEAEERQRSVMIRKSLQTRVDATTAPVSPPARTRSKTWHARSRRASGEADTDTADESEGLLTSLRGTWTEHEARVERTWQMLHRKYPTRRVTLPVEEEGGPMRPPTIRLKTPPLLSHPMFRGCWNGDADVRHTSVPTELARVRPAPI
ncbi:hypothetical protein CTRI78_v006553 [Colletotrichum trifolii]|uniref:Uncharacterized protein n=1 Tax=Colletotrichum trifolii TaxID=5466 RepID=A0A4R8RC69_COLTR|nr:hypothetical protein CTRI78_v006553 [Colletotrichum trifolii]